MSNKVKILRLAYFLLFILYPVAIFLGFKFFGARAASLLLLGIILFYFLSLKNDQKSSRLQKYSVIIVASALLILAQISNQIFFVKIYPVAVNLIFLAAFSYSLFSGPSMIEKFARIYDKNLSAKAISYTRKVTIIWCVFFIFNASISLYTTLFSSIEIWTLYNGFISYMIMGALFAGEYAVRYFVIKKDE
ncbi:MAG: putative membrane protein [Rickettsiales bacterium]|jgi:uncharacterized membrane protein